MPLADPVFPGSGAIGAQSSYYQPGYYSAPPVANQPAWYLGTPIPNPHAPAAYHGVQKVPGYDPALTYNTVVKAINSGHDAQCQSKNLLLWDYVSTDGCFLLFFSFP